MLLSSSRKVLAALAALVLAGTASAQTLIQPYVPPGGALPPTTTATTQPILDNSTLIATDAFVQTRAAVANASVVFNNVTGGTYSFASLGSGATVVFLASGGALTSVLSVAVPGAGYAVGDVLTPTGGNSDAYVRVTGVSGGAITTASIAYGGTGYGTGGSLLLSSANTFPKVFITNGVLTSNTTVILPNGTFQQGSRERLSYNNTTGAFTKTICVSNGANACTGTTLLVPQGTANSLPVSWFSDGSTGVWLATTAAGPAGGDLSGTYPNPTVAAVGGHLFSIGGSGGLTFTLTGPTTVTLPTSGTLLSSSNNLSDLALASTARTNLGLGTSATVNTGTSGATIPLLNGANTWSALQTFGVVTGSNATETGFTTPTVGASETYYNSQGNGYVDSTQSANNKIVEWVWAGGVLTGRFVNDAYNTVTNFMQITGGQGSGVTAISFPSAAPVGIQSLSPSLPVYTNASRQLTSTAPAGYSAVLSGTTAAIGGGALTPGSCVAGTVTVTGATSAMVATASPSTDPDSTLSTGVAIYSFVSATNTVTVRICAIVAVTPTAVTYNVRVLQ